MLDLFLKLLEKIIEFAEKHRRMKQSLHDNFAAPLMQQFEDVHLVYIESFKLYINCVINNGSAFSRGNDVFKKIEADMVFSHASRVKLLEMSKALMPLFEKSTLISNDNVAHFIYTMYDYINSISLINSRMSNAPRISLLESLGDIADGRYESYGLFPAQMAERVILEKMMEMQQMYSDVQHAYQRAKADMLN